MGSRAAFTMFELLLVVGIVAMVAAIGIPAIVHSMKREGMRKATADLLEACSHARASAIFSGQITELVIRPLDRTFSVNAGGSGSETKSHFSATLPDDVHIDIMGVNFVEMQDQEEARVRFYPNGTSDEFAILFIGDNGDARKITLDVVTAMPDLEVVR